MEMERENNADLGGPRIDAGFTYRMARPPCGVYVTNARVIPMMERVPRCGLNDISHAVFGNIRGRSGIRLIYGVGVGMSG